jgi:hypothetical protein
MIRKKGRQRFALAAFSLGPSAPNAGCQCCLVLHFDLQACVEEATDEVVTAASK